MDMKPTSSARSPEAGRAKKSYETPQLVVYGDIREITTAVAMNNSPDGAAHGNSRTS
jgi:hypothetical protein